jgi:hypothetical protein
MKLEEISPNQGTYVGLRLLDPGSRLLYEHCKAVDIPVKQSTFDRRLHTTLIYSRKHCPDLSVDPKAVYDAEFAGYSIFTGQNGENVLVVLLNSPQIVARHIKLMADHNAKYDHPVFHPHITLSYNYHSPTVAGIPAFNFPLHLGEEYTEDLDLSWKK